MSRQYKIDVIVDEHGAVETLKRVSDAEDQVAAGGSKLGTVLDTLSSKQKIVVADTRGMDEAFGRSTVTTTQMYFALDDMSRGLVKLPSTFSQVRGGLNELAEGAGITVEGLGMLNAAGLVIGAGYVGWGIGRVISDFLGLDDPIANATARLVGFGDVGAEQAGAKADTLALATQRAGRAITDFGEALRVNQQWLDDWKTKAQQLDDTLTRQRGAEESAKQIRGWGAEIERVTRDGALNALTDDLESHNFSQGQLAQRYRISTEAIGFFQRQLAATAREWKDYDTFVDQAIKRQDEMNRKTDEAAKKTEEWRLKVREIELSGDHAYSTLHQWLGELARDQKYVNELVDQSVQKMFAADAAAQKFLRDELAAALAQDAIYQTGRAVAGSPNDGSQARGYGINQNPNIVPISQTGASSSSSYTGASSLPGGDTRGGSIYSGVNYNPSLRSFDIGGPTGPGGLALLHPDEYVVPKGGALVSGGGATTTIVNIDAKGATFENDQALDRLADKIATRLGVRYVQRGGG